MDTITITLVQTDDGRLVGRTASDRWNLAMLGLTDLVDDGRSGAALKRARRQLQREFGADAFKLVKSRARSVSLPTTVEVEALGGSLALAA